MASRKRSRSKRPQRRLPKGSVRSRRLNPQESRSLGRSFRRVGFRGALRATAAGRRVSAAERRTFSRSDRRRVGRKTFNVGTQRGARAFLAAGGGGD